MAWATRHIATLRVGKAVSFRPRGHSMARRIKSGNLVTVEPLNGRAPQVGEIVLCSVRGAQYLHLVKAIGPRGFLVGNNRGGINGWTPAAQVHGRCVRIEP